MKPLIRVTQIESFRRYMEQSDNAKFVITEQSVIDSITGEFQGNEYTRIGTAFHFIVETGCPECVKVPAGVREFTFYGKHATEPVPEGRQFNIDGFPVVLDVEQCKVAMDYRNEHPNAFHEFRIFHDYGSAIVTGCADMIDGLVIRDIKTKYSNPEDSDYINSCQWKYYLEMFGADTFHFDLFCFDGYDKDKHGYDVRGLKLTRHTPAITCYWDKHLETYNKKLLDDFLRWASDRNLIDYFMRDTI